MRYKTFFLVISISETFLSLIGRLIFLSVQLNEKWNIKNKKKNYSFKMNIKIKSIDDNLV